MFTNTMNKKPIITLFICITMSLVSTTYAQVVNVTGSPHFNLSLAQSSNVKLAWAVTVNNGVTSSFSSTKILVRAGTDAGPVIFTINKTIRINTTAGMRTHNTSETVLLPAHVTYKIRKMNHSRVYFTRSFTDQDNKRTGFTVATLTGNVAAKFSISSLKLRIRDRSSGQNPNAKAPIVALASVRYNGSGIVRGVWEVATIGISTKGHKKTSLFRPLTRVTQHVLGGHTDLFSPSLPAIKGNQYIIRLRILSPVISKNNIPTLIYSPNIIRPERSIH
ncbi:hypothetical protein MNBD_GAMMA12-61 [hydrothermal vent metagenome]|uniref:Uncharacterized protein n=1 Tax=hydrothermal vent metagenome TaxID=652676 RepID=A0A3B0ZEK2_9ZZZZ